MGKKLLVILFGILSIGVGAFLFISSMSLAKRCTVEATGKVVEIIEEKEENRDAEDAGAIVSNTYTYTYYPVIEYQAGTETVKEKSTTGYGQKDKFTVGQTIDILYNPNEPTEYIIKGEKTANIVGIGFMAVGVIIIMIGIVKKEF